ncbi:MAG: DUF4830 domain-containing protein [Ruminococcaceae bacterium]|nr:DUF4830 domain-containing protein [Oscillospiraceae bacterium]
MFICTMRAGTVRFFGVVCLALATLIALIAFVPELQPVAADTGEESTTVNFEKVKSNDDRIAFLKQFGWEVVSEPTEATTVTVPAEFDKIFAAYNELQKKQGLDLTPYGNRTVERYTYTVTNYPDYAGTVQANLLVFRGRVIGGDISSADANGFIRGFGN